MATNFDFYSRGELGRERELHQVSERRLKRSRGGGDGDQVLYKLLFFFLRLKFLNSWRDKSVKLNSTLQIQCFVRGFPKPEVKWTKDGKLVNTRNMLTINRVTYGDAGQYTCSAKNSEGKNEAAFHITVTVKR